MSKPIDRITMFRIPNEDDIDTILAQYKIMIKDAQKDGKPYIVSAVARRTHADPRTKGFTIVAQTTFKSLEDMQYYDNECQAHMALKKVVGPIVQAPKPENMMTLYMDAVEQGKL